MKKNDVHILVRLICLFLPGCRRKTISLNDFIQVDETLLTEWLFTDVCQ